MSWRPSPALLGLTNTWSETCVVPLRGSHSSPTCVCPWLGPFIDRIYPTVALLLLLSLCWWASGLFLFKAVRNGAGTVVSTCAHVSGAHPPHAHPWGAPQECRVGGGLTLKELTKSLCCVQWLLHYSPLPTKCGLQPHGSLPHCSGVLPHSVVMCSQVDLSLPPSLGSLTLSPHHTMASRSAGLIQCGPLD